MYVCVRVFSTLQFEYLFFLDFSCAIIFILFFVLLRFFFIVFVVLPVAPLLTDIRERRRECVHFNSEVLNGATTTTEIQMTRPFPKTNAVFTEAETNRRMLMKLNMFSDSFI